MLSNEWTYFSRRCFKNIEITSYTEFPFIQVFLVKNLKAALIPCNAKFTLQVFLSKNSLYWTLANLMVLWLLFVLWFNVSVNNYGHVETISWAPSSEFVSSSILSWQMLTPHAQPFRGASDLVFCLKVPLDSLPVWASSGGSGETARMRRLAWTFAARIGDKYQIRLTRSS